MKYDEITRQADDAIRELLAIAKLEKGDIFIILAISTCTQGQKTYRSIQSS